MTFLGLVRANNLNDVVDRERAWDNLGANISANIPIPSPSLDLNFASNKSLVDNVSGQNLITFTRPSTGTFVGSNGFIQTAASGVPRFDHNGATGESLGLLIEGARTNYILNSSVFTNAGFWQGNQGITISPNQALAPDGITFNGTLIQQDTSTSLHQLSKGTFGQQLFTTSSNYTISVFVKRFNANRITLCESHHYGLGGYTKAGMVWDFSTESIVRTFQWGDSSQSRIAGTSVTKHPNGWYRISLAVTPGGDSNNQYVFPALVIGDSGDPNGFGRSAFVGNGVDGVYIWGFQTEIGTFSTSYIPTVASTVTRAADVAQITGTNLSSFYNAGRGTIYAEQFKQAGTGGVAIGDTASNRLLDWQSSRIYRTSWEGVNYTWTGAPAVSATSLNRAALAYGQTVQGSVNGSSYVLSPFIATASFPTTSLAFQGAFSRIVFWGDQLPSSAIAAITSISNVQIGALPSSYATNATTLGKDIAALNAVRNASTRDFVFIKGLLSAAQPRLTTAAALASSGTASQNASLLKASPTTAGNFFINRGGIVASGLRVNNTNIASLSSSAFSGSTALFPIVVSSLKLSSGLRWAPAMTSGTVTSPDRAIPIETSEFILFAKAGQS